MASKQQRKLVLVVGQICADFITLCDSYAAEDSENRVSGQYWQKGGNAANCAAVLSNLGTRSEFLGTFPDTGKMAQKELGGLAEARFVLNELDKHNVLHDHLALRDCQRVPSTAIVLSESSGTRTIYHYRGSLDELTFEDFSVLDLTQYRWIHFEGRYNIETMKRQMQMIAQFNAGRSSGDRVFVSLELELPANEGLVALCPLADLVIISRYFALHLGFQTAKDCVRDFKNKVKTGSSVVCSWGSLGAAYVENRPDYEAAVEPAVKPHAVVDTLGAGDTFQGALIHAMLNGLPLKDTVAFACRVASKKISEFGYDGIIGMGLNFNKTH